MKRALTMGMLVLATTVSFSAVTHAAAVEAKVEIAKYLEDYTESIKKSLGVAASHGNVEIQAKVVDSLISKGKFSSSETDIKIAVGHDPVKIETFTRLTAAKVAATEIKTTHPDEAASLEKMADASVKFMKNSNGIEAFTFKSNKTLTQDQFGLTTEAIKKANTVLSKAITYKMGERDSWAQVYEKFDQLSAGDQFGTPQEAFVQAIMDVKKVNREQAMEIVRKIKDCV